MKRIIISLTLFVSCVCSLLAQADAMLGNWITIDDKTGEERSIVHLFKATNGKYYGKIVRIFEEQYSDAVCTPCKDADHNKPVVGLLIIREMEAQGNYLTGGSVLDPESGNTYYGKISLEKGMLKLRGSIDKAGLLGRSQYWKKQEN